jgi:predicted nuclease with TOPRIM domain
MTRAERRDGFEPVSPELALVDPELVAGVHASIIAGVLAMSADEIREIRAMLTEITRAVSETDQTVERLMRALLKDDPEIMELRERAERVQRETVERLMRALLEDEQEIGELRARAEQVERRLATS